MHTNVSVETIETVVSWHYVDRQHGCFVCNRIVRNIICDASDSNRVIHLADIHVSVFDFAGTCVSGKSSLQKRQFGSLSIKAAFEFIGDSFVKLKPICKYLCRNKPKSIPIPTKKKYFQSCLDVKYGHTCFECVHDLIIYCKWNRYPLVRERH